MTAADRTRIAEILDQVPGLQAYAYEPAEKHPGAAWPVLREFNRDGGVFASPFVTTYDVFAILTGASPEELADQAEELFPLLVTALEPLGEWQLPAEVIQIAFPNGSTVPALRVRITPDPE